MDNYVTETPSEGSQDTQNDVKYLDKYTFFGCHLTGQEYQFQLDHHEICSEDYCLLNPNVSTFMKRSQSLPCNLHSFCGNDFPFLPPWLNGDSCLQKAFSHGWFSDPTFTQQYEAYTICPVCHEEAHDYQHLFGDLDLKEDAKLYWCIPDSITTDTVPETTCDQVVPFNGSLIQRK